MARRDMLLQVVLLNGAMISGTVHDERMFRDAWWHGGQEAQDRDHATEPAPA